MFVGKLVSLLALALGARGQDVASECPTPNGFFADARQCDKYYKCTDNVLSEKLCPDGMAFNDINPDVERCDLIAAVDCKDRPQLQPAKPTEHCKRLNGNFAPDEPNCAQAYRCVEGISTLITCPVGLAFALETGICDWPDQTKRSDCHNKKDNETFTCPSVKLSVAGTHPRYADPLDCQYFYVCINGKTARRNGCTFGQVFNTNTSTCTTPQEVYECSDYYTEYFDEYFKNIANNPNKLDPSIVAAAKAAGYDVPEFRDRVRIGGKPTGATASATRDTPSPPVRTRVTPRVRPTIASTANEPAARPPSRPSSTGESGGGRRHRPGATGPGGLRRRRKRPRATTTSTTTTTTPPPEYYDEYYYDEYYDEIPSDNTAGDTTASATGSDSFVSPSESTSRTSLPISRFTA